MVRGRRKKEVFDNEEERESERQTVIGLQRKRGRERIEGMYVKEDRGDRERQNKL